MTPEQMAELAARLHKQAQIHRQHFKTADQLEWADTIDTAADLIDSMAQREPVAWADPLDIGEDQVTFYGASHRWHVGHDGTRYSMPLYSAPAAQRVPLTDEQIWELWVYPPDMSWKESVIMLGRTIEQAHGIRSEK